MIKKLLACAVLGIALVLGAFFVLFLIAMRQGPSIDTLARRIGQSLMVDPSRLSFLGGNTGREPSVFFMLSGGIPEKADVRALNDWAREDNAKLFNRLATRHHIPHATVENSELLNYKGDAFDLYVVKVPKGHCILYWGLY